MKTINNVLLCGLGAIGGYYASKFVEHNIALKVLVDKGRYEQYTKKPRVINNVAYDFDYILPEESGYVADLIIISTKSSGFAEAVKNIANFVGENTVILSFLNGITSELTIIERYGDKVLFSYLVGHTFFRKGDVINHDGNAKIVFGSDRQSDSRVNLVSDIFDKLGVKYEVSDNIKKSQWEKFCFNCCVNQISALTRKTFGEMKKSDKCLNLMKHISDEISKISQKENNFETDFYKKTIEFLDLMIPNGKTSMLQDIENGKTPEVDLFGKTVTFLGGKHNIQTPYNKVISEILDSLS